MDLEVPGKISSLALQTIADQDHEQHARIAAPTDADALKAICDWFDRRGVAWSGTRGELAMEVGRPPRQVAHAIEAESIGLLIFGIAASLSRRSGSPTLISLRRLEKIWTPAEESLRNPSVAPEQNESYRQPRAVLCSPEAHAQEGESSASQWLREDLGAEPIMGNATWRDKPALLTLSPADDPSLTAGGKVLWIARAVGALFRTTLGKATGRIGPGLSSIASRSSVRPERPQSDSGDGRRLYP